MAKFDKRYFDNELHLANTSAIVDAEPHISGNCIQRFIKKLIKKCVEFYIGENVGKQNEFNVHVVNILNEMNEQIFQNENLDDGIGSSAQSGAMSKNVYNTYKLLSK